MREIKFRAWDRDLDAFVYSDGFGLSAFFYGQEDSQYETEPEQFTGLRDKNGKEIYEGDIVKYWYDLGPAGEYEGVAEAYIGNYGVGPMEEWNYTEGRIGGDNWLPEVIGNIHENPELLK